jgi:hypothetical protein
MTHGPIPSKSLDYGALEIPFGVDWRLCWALERVDAER